MWSMGNSLLLLIMWHENSLVSRISIHFLIHIANHPASIITFGANWLSLAITLNLRQVSGIKYLNQMRTYHLACGDSEIM